MGFHGVRHGCSRFGLYESQLSRGVLNHLKSMISNRFFQGPGLRKIKQNEYFRGFFQGTGLRKIKQNEAFRGFFQGSGLRKIAFATATPTARRPYSTNHSFAMQRVPTPCVGSVHMHGFYHTPSARSAELLHALVGQQRSVWP